MENDKLNARFEDDEETIDLREIFMLLWRHAAIIILTALLFAVAGFAATALFMTPQYRADATMIVNTRQDVTANVTSDQISSAQKLVDTYSIIIKSDTVLDQVIQNLGLSLDYQELDEKVSVAAVNSTQVMQISVTDPNPESARLMCAEITNVAPAAIVDAVEAGSVKIVSAARVGEDPVSPSKAKNTAIAGLLGLVLAVGIIVVRELLNNTIKNDEDIQKKLGLSVMGVIPRVRQPGDKNKKEKPGKEQRGKGHTERKLIALNGKDVNFAYAEAYKSLRTNLNFLAVSNECKTIIVTSALASEGKSSVTINLCTALAASGKKVILVDCDLRKPIIHRYLRITSKRSLGLTGVLSGTVSLADAIVPTGSEYGMHVLTAGAIPPNPAELLGSAKMRKLVEKLGEAYDYVILDTPPVSVVTDAAVVGSYADGALLVVRQDFANTETVQLAQRNLEATGVHILGTILNEFDAKISGSNTGYSYSYYYNYSYGDGDQKEKQKA